MWHPSQWEVTRCFAGRFAGVQLCTDDSIIDVLADC